MTVTAPSLPSGPRNLPTTPASTTTTPIHSAYATGVITSQSGSGSKSRSQSQDNLDKRDGAQSPTNKQGDNPGDKGQQGSNDNPNNCSQVDAGGSAGILGAIRRGINPTDAEKISVLERQVKDQKKKIKDLSAELSEKLQQCEAYRVTNSTIDGKWRGAETRILELKSHIKQYKEHNDALKVDIGNLDHHIRVTLDNHIRGLDDKILVLKQENDDLKGDLLRERQRAKRLEDELDKSKGLAETRRLELKGSENFLTKADVLAASDVKKLVEELNDEIYQSSATMTEEGSFPELKPVKVDCKQEVKALEPVVGAGAVNLLRNAQPEDHIFILQTVLQACMIYWAARIVPCWNFDVMEIQDYLDTVYKKLREEEEQAVAGRWRALTRAQLYSARKDQADIPSKAVSFINESLVNVMIVAGYERKVAQDHVWKHAKNIELIARASLDLNKTMGEKFTSADLEVVIFSPGQKFNPLIMEDANETPATKKQGKRDGERVLCMSSLGMGQKEGKPKQKALLLLKPKVILESIAQDLGAEKGPIENSKNDPKTDGKTHQKGDSVNKTNGKGGSGKGGDDRAAG